MKLADKGPIKPPPALKGPAQLVSQEIQSWPGIVAATHWFLYDRTQVDGADFYVGERELGHIHLDGEIHLGATRTLAAMLIEHDLADPFEWGDAWVQYPICKKADVGHADFVPTFRRCRHLVRRDRPRQTPGSRWSRGSEFVLLRHWHPGISAGMPLHVLGTYDLQPFVDCPAQRDRRRPGHRESAGSSIVTSICSPLPL